MKGENLTMDKEEQAFIEFMAKLEQKAIETHNDFNNLSDNNKLRVMTIIMQVFEKQGVVGLMNYLSNGIGNNRNN